MSGIVSNPEDYVYCSAKNYFGSEDVLMDDQLIDFGVEQGYRLT